MKIGPVTKHFPIIDIYLNSMFWFFFLMRFLKPLPFYQNKVVLDIVKHKVFIEGPLDDQIYGKKIEA